MKKISAGEEIENNISGYPPRMNSSPSIFVGDIEGIVVKDNIQPRSIKRAADIEETRVKKELERAERKKSADQLRVLGENLLASGVASREILPKLAQSIIVELGLRLASGEWEIKSAEEATKVAKIWYDILRLESGQATVINETLISSPEDRFSRLEELKSEAKRRVEAGLRAIGEK